MEIKPSSEEEQSSDSEIYTKVKENLARTGTIKIVIGAIFVFFGLLSFVFSPIIFTGLFLTGVSLIVWGIGNVFSKKEGIDAEILRINRKMYGVDEPDIKWECPHCKNQNPNTTYICQKCKRRLV